MGTNNHYTHEVRNLVKCYKPGFILRNYKSKDEQIFLSSASYVNGSYSLILHSLGLLFRDRQIFILSTWLFTLATFSEFRRRNLVPFFETFCKVGDIVETNGIGNFGDIEIPFFQQRECHF